MAGDMWRTEADDAWLAGRRSTILSRLRRLPILSRIAHAVSHAETGPYAGAPRDPRLRVDDDKAYTTVRYTTGTVAYTTTSTSPDQCPRCGQPTIEKHDIEYVRHEDNRIPVGTVRTCRACQTDSWLSRSAMPAASRARTIARKTVV